MPRFIKYTGYGNAAGLLAARGLMAGGRPLGQYSEDEDTDTDEYKEAKARCVPPPWGPLTLPPSPPHSPLGRRGGWDSMTNGETFCSLTLFLRDMHPDVGTGPGSVGARVARVPGAG